MTTSVNPKPLGDSAIILSLGTSQDKQLLARVHLLARALSELPMDDVEDIVPSYLGVTVFYDSLSVSYDDMKRRLTSAVESIGVSEGHHIEGREHRIPVRYDGEDLPGVAMRLGISTDEVVETHLSQTYTVDLLGFVPGFAYLSELPTALQLPRREQPRPRVSAGSVAIAGPYTGVYPLNTPGGWHLIGRTEVILFDPLRTPPALLSPGDSVRFVRA